MRSVRVCTQPHNMGAAPTVCRGVGVALAPVTSTYDSVCGHYVPHAGLCSAGVRYSVCGC